MIYEFNKNWGGYDQWPFKAIIVVGDSTRRITKQNDIVNMPIDKSHLDKMIEDDFLVKSEDEQLYKYIAKLLLEDGKI